MGCVPGEWDIIILPGSVEFGLSQINPNKPNLLLKYLPQNLAVVSIAPVCATCLEDL